jgi:hypothetical protein
MTLTEIPLLSAGSTTPGDALANPTDAFDVAGFLHAYDAVNTVWKRLRVGTGGGLLVEWTAQSTPGAAAPSKGVMVGGSDGTNLRTFATDPAGNQRVIPPDAQKIAADIALTWAASAAQFTTVVQVLSAAPISARGGNPGLAVAITNPSAVTALICRVQYSFTPTSGTQAWGDLSTNTAPEDFTVAASSSQVFLIDGGVLGDQIRLSVRNGTVLGAGQGFTARGVAWAF